MKRGRRKAASREKVFGCDLLEHLSATAQEIPQVLRSCSEFIEEFGIVDGIYRLSGVSSNTQKLRGEFDAEGSPDLCKDVYLQDIHCVSSLCKAYFRELPNPLLTYQLYDRFAEAVAVQLEDERMLRIKDVLKDLPLPHYRTLQFLMRHLVKMSTFADQTNMHSRNLAIVWAPNLLRSKDIESTGFNGTAAFMEVRVQSIVVEFILTHVTDIFPESGLAVERRKSLPSSCLAQSHPEESFFQSFPPLCPGNLSPGDGPPAMRPYHAIIDPSEKKKGSLKTRKWKSIFNLGGRLHDPRKKNKFCPKGKETSTLRPAKSMDSLSLGVNEDSKNCVGMTNFLSRSEGVTSAGGCVSSGYAVTYRRTGGAQVSMMSDETAGSYSRLESGSGSAVSEFSPQVVSRSPGLSSKAERRAGIHISGPFSVTVPLHITSGLALGVMHGGRGDTETTLLGNGKSEEDEDAEMDAKSLQSSEEKHISSVAPQMDTEEVSRHEDLPDIEATDEETDVHAQDTNEADEGDYMEMKGNLHHTPVSTGSPEHELPLDLQEAFGFLDLMDNSTSTQLEFSVEPPGFEELEESDAEEHPSLSLHISEIPNTETETPPAPISTPTFNHRPLSGKSHSLPYKSRPFLPALSLSSDDEYSQGDSESDGSDQDSMYENMFCQSLPSAAFHHLSHSCQHTADGKDIPALNQSECRREEQINSETSRSQPGMDMAVEKIEATESVLHDQIHEQHPEIDDDEEEDTYFGPDPVSPLSPQPDNTQCNKIGIVGLHIGEHLDDDDAHCIHPDSDVTDDVTSMQNLTDELSADEGITEQHEKAGLEKIEKKENDEEMRSDESKDQWEDKSQKIEHLTEKDRDKEEHENECSEFRFEPEDEGGTSAEKVSEEDEAEQEMETNFEKDKDFDLMADTSHINSSIAGDRNSGERHSDICESVPDPTASEDRDMEEKLDELMTPIAFPAKVWSQGKAVPVVPPKPQISITLRKQLQHRHEQHREDPVELDRGSDAHQQRRGTWDSEMEQKREREVKRSSGISMCFDEAVARATVKRSRERESTERTRDREARKDGEVEN